MINYIDDPNVSAICFPSNGSYTFGGKLLLEDTRAQALVRAYPEIEINLVSKLKQIKKNVPYIVGVVGETGLLNNFNLFEARNNKYKCIIFSFPIKNKYLENNDEFLIKNSYRVIEEYINYLKLLGKVIIACPKVKDSENIIFI